MTYNYYILNPTGNITALVNSACPKEKYKIVADSIMQKHPEVEQVGFVNFHKDLGSPMLCMTGGEFCGNASISAAALKCILNNTREEIVSLSVSGESAPVKVEVKRLVDGEYIGCVEMPLPIKITSIAISEKTILPVIVFRGIAHAIAIDNIPEIEIESVLKKSALALGVPCFGIMFTNNNFNSIRPVVYVREADTIVWESSCASGSTALAAYISSKKNREEFIINQPAGSLSVYISSRENLIKMIQLESKVKLMFENSIEI